eukprot:scaffold59245_cov36-Tisochrysis_lutea.AAC.5
MLSDSSTTATARYYHDSPQRSLARTPCGLEEGARCNLRFGVNRRLATPHTSHPSFRDSCEASPAPVQPEPEGDDNFFTPSPSPRTMQKIASRIKKRAYTAPLARFTIIRIGVLTLNPSRKNNAHNPRISGGRGPDSNPNTLSKLEVVVTVRSCDAFARSGHTEESEELTRRRRGSEFRITYNEREKKEGEERAEGGSERAGDQEGGDRRGEREFVSPRVRTKKRRSERLGGRPPFI